jgi:hypothetical protein
VYVVQEGVARQRVVETGLRQDGMQEIAKGIGAGETVATDGAGFLTDGASVALPRPQAADKGSKAAKGAKKG